MPAGVTPMMRQYLELKEKYNDCLLFFRLGDFYEMFFDDAVTASKELELILTGRDCGLETRAPMCGVPYHSVDSYITKLIEKGYKVAVCEQLTEPGVSTLVERDVVRIITPGTVIEESMLSEGSNNYIAALFLQDENIGMSYSDISTGSFFMMEFSGGDRSTQLIDELARIQPREIIANEAFFMQELLIKRIKANGSVYMQCYRSNAFELDKARQRLLNHFKTASLEGFGCQDKEYGICAAGALMTYFEETQKNALTHIAAIKYIYREKYMVLDVSTRRNLELTQPLRYDGSRRNTLLHILNKTRTAMGSRLLKSWIEQPLQLTDQIQLRLDVVEELYKKPVMLDMLAKALDGIYDIERLCSKIAYGTINPRDCIALKLSLFKIPGIIELISQLKTEEAKRICLELDPMEDIASLLENAIMPEPSISAKDGGIIRQGYNARVDSYREACENGKNWLAKLEADERQKTGIKNLKIGYNKVFGYYIDVTKSYQHLVPYNYQRKQTLANSERYITESLKELEETILGAEEKCIALEYKLFAELREILLQCIDRLQNNAIRLAELDVYRSLAEAARVNNYCKPTISANGEIEITEGRHPVVELGMKGGFIPNDTFLDKNGNRLLILTGPNMAGKSTYMRQVALITLMAHIGSFVPAKKAKISLTDRIFTRVGASDNLAAGQSTFMVEMSEMANILNNATSNSLLILDEIGRGTSTFDGLSIAWSVLEHIADKKLCGAKTLFATHYHELTELEGKLHGIKNYRISVKEVGDDIIFLRKIVRGGADKSFGIQVAKLAGLPESVVERAKVILKDLEASDINQKHATKASDQTPQQITLFGANTPDDILSELKNLNIEALTPVQALNILYDLHLRSLLR